MMFLTSCIPLKDIKYIQPDENLKLNEHGMIEYNRPEYHLQINDVLNNRVSMRKEDEVEELNDFSVTTAQTGSGSISPSSGRGVRIQDYCNIELPKIGTIYLLGLTLKEA